MSQKKPAWDRWIEEAAREGRRRSARWDEAFYAQQGASVVRWMAQSLAMEPAEHTGPVLRAYARLLAEGVGEGYLTPAATGLREGAVHHAGHQSLMSHCFLQVLPWGIRRVPEAQRLQTLEMCWNLCEGLRREPAWVDRYVVACAQEDDEGWDELSAWPKQVAEVLQPVLSPPPAPTWAGPFEVERVSLKEGASDFLPGELFWASPWVLCVRDRRHEDVVQSLFLRREGKARRMGLVNGLAPALHARPVGVEVGFGRDEVRIGANAVALPWLRHIQASAVSEAGFVAACAPDSQCVWIVGCG